MKPQINTTICSFPQICPINNVEEGIAKGNYNAHLPFVTTVLLERVQGTKKLYLVCFNREIRCTEYVGLLRAEGKQPCRNASQYLLGLMAQVPEDQIPRVFQEKDIIAAEPGGAHLVCTLSSSLSDIVYFFLCVSRYDGCRTLVGIDAEDTRLKRHPERIMVGETEEETWRDNLAFLAEDLLH